LVGGPPGVELHTVVDELPSGDTDDMVPVVLPMIAAGMVPNGVAGISAADDIALVDGVGTGAAVMAGGGGAGIAGGGGAGTVEPGKVDRNDVAGCADSVSIGAVVLLVDVEEVAGPPDIAVTAETDGNVAVVPPVADMDVTGTAAVPGPICPVGVEQVTTVPGVVGSEASGTGASVVTGVPGCVVTENGLGPLSGDVTIVPGVDERPMAVLPMVETWARQAVQPASMMAVVNSKCRISIPSAPNWLPALHVPRPCCLPPGSPSD
jgi:hypothetical protein